MIPVFSAKIASFKGEVGGGRFGIPDRVDIFVASTTEPLVRNLQGKKNRKFRDL